MLRADWHRRRQCSIMSGPVYRLSRFDPTAPIGNDWWLSGTGPASAEDPSHPRIRKGRVEARAVA
ncbi:hypothetical protein R2601_04253 [Salipiger bermudensis HTCC2601]|uniref:Uncharacterized protein n=1 Tax=Salipiger bermudensis (strain DSM 26914 / JCM 13377 / KCTC 12554 / HTCC2601) TaxID=314265 RepID=Q0FVZ5_SALBH|nr:hypothetical protein R2601_04253 [Salipiger bermudensis HTCC2601]